MTDQAKTSTFTTLRWDGAFSVAHFEAHLTRLKQHANRLSIQWPAEAKELAVVSLISAFSNADKSTADTDVGLVRLRLNQDGSMEANTRWLQSTSNSQKGPEKVSATAVVSQRWDEEITGCKHGEWQSYHDAQAKAEKEQCKIALLIHDDAVIDCQSSTPLILDNDGTAWYPASSQGAVDSISLASIATHLENAGVPLIPGRLTRILLARSRAVIAIGTGIGVVSIQELDGQQVGGDSQEFANLCFQAFNNSLESGWIDLREVKS